MQLGKYQLIHKLATGGMAEVFLAKAAGPKGFEKLLVLKRILPHLATEPTFVDMFLSEARLAAQLNHPNIVQIFDFGEAEGTYFLAMEYIDGPNLRELIRRASGVSLALPIAFCARVISAACEGLAFAHECKDQATLLPMNLIHRDISPDNILLSRQGAVKVVDFGIAKAGGMSPHTQTGVLKGKLAYMAPEQLRNEALDRRADVYALGVVLYELLTGLKPFMANSEAAMVQAILFELQVPVVQRRPDVPEALQRILARALAKERERRYPDCASFQEELEAFLISTGKPMGASQMALLVSMMTAGSEGPGGFAQKTASGPRSNPRLSTSQPPAESSPVASARLPADPVPAREARPPDIRGLREERTSVERPSRLLHRDNSLPPPTPEPPRTSLPQPELLKGTRRPEKETVGVALVGIFLLLAGGGFLSQLSSKFGSNPPLPGSATVSGQGLPGGVQGASGSQEVLTPPRSQDSIKPQSHDGGAPASHSAPDAGVVSPRVDPLIQLPGRGQGTVDLLIVPESLLWVDGWQYGPQRKKLVSLEPGKHRLRVVNKQLRKDVVREFSISAGQTTEVDINLLEE